MTNRNDGGRYRRVILSEAKDLLATLDPSEMILRFAQDDTWFISSRN